MVLVIIAHSLESRHHPTACVTMRRCQGPNFYRDHLHKLGHQGADGKLSRPWESLQANSPLGLTSKRFAFSEEADEPQEPWQRGSGLKQAWHARR